MRVIGLGWEDLNTYWSKNGKALTLEELALYLKMTVNRFQINMSTIPTFAVILGHHGMGTLSNQPIFILFETIWSSTQFTLLIVYWGKFFLCIYSCVLKCVPVLCPVFFYLSKNKFHFYLSKELTNPKGISIRDLK